MSFPYFFVGTFIEALNEVLTKFTERHFPTFS